MPRARTAPRPASMASLPTAVLKASDGTTVPLQGVSARGRLDGLLFELTVELFLLKHLGLLSLVLDTGLVPVLKHVLIERGVIAGFATTFSAGTASFGSSESSASAGTTTALTAILDLASTTLAIVTASSEATASLEATLLTVSTSSSASQPVAATISKLNHF